MSTANRPTNSALSEKRQHARALLDECIAGLESKPARRAARSALPPPRKSHTAPNLDFDVHERAFIKAHGKGLSGPKKFVLLLAYMTKGKAGKEVQFKDIEKH